MIYSNIIWVSHIIDTFILKYKIHKKHNKALHKIIKNKLIYRHLQNGSIVNKIIKIFQIEIHKVSKMVKKSKSLLHKVKILISCKNN